MLGVGEGILESGRAEEQKGRPEGQESTGCDTDVEIRADVDGETGKDSEESVVCTAPVKARRDAFI